MSYHRVRDLAERLKEEADILRDTAANLEDGSAAEDVVEGVAEDIDGVIRRLTGFKGDIAGEPEIERWETVRWTETVEGDNGEPMTVELVEQVAVTRERQPDAAKGGDAKSERATLTGEVQGLLGRLGTVLDELRHTRGLDEEPARKTADALLEVAGKLEAVVGQHAAPPEGEQAAGKLAPPQPPSAESGKGDRKGSKVKSPSP